MANNISDRQQEASLAVLQAIHILATTSPIEEGWRSSLVHFCEGLGIETAAVFPLHEEDGNQPFETIALAFGPVHQNKADAPPESLSSSEKAQLVDKLRTGACSAVVPPFLSHLWPNLFPQDGSCKNLLCPILLEERLWGVLALSYYQDRAPARESLKSVTLPFAHSLGSSIRQHGLALALQQRNALWPVIESAELAIWDWDISGKILQFNSHFARMIGYEQAEMESTMDFFVGLIHDDDREIFVAKAADSLRLPFNKQLFEQEIRLRAKDGSYRSIINRGRAIVWNTQGEALRATGIFTDVTKRKKAQLALQESQRLYKNFVDYSIEGIYFIRCRQPVPIHLPPEEQASLYYQTAVIEECNLALAKMYGMESPKSLIGYTVARLHDGPKTQENRNVFIQFVHNNYQSKGAETFELTLDGELRCMLNHAIGIVEDGYLAGVWGTQLDVTEQRKAENDLLKNKKKTELTLEAANMGLWEWEPASGKCKFSHRWASMLGYELSAIEPHADSFTALLHPEDKGPTWGALNRHIEEQNPAFELEFRLRTHTGNWKWILSKGRTVEWTDEGSPALLAGVHIDIDERKKAEFSLRESETLFRSLFEDSPLGLTLSDARGAIKRINEKFESLLGYSQEEICGKTFADISVPKEHYLERGRIEQAVRQRKATLQFEKELAHKDGHTIWASMLLSFNYSSEGKLDYIIYSLEEITEKRKAQKALEETEAFQKAILNALPDLKLRIDKEGRFLSFFGSQEPNAGLFLPSVKFIDEKAEEVMPSYLAQAIMRNLDYAFKERRVQAFEYPLFVNNELHSFEARISAIDSKEAIMVIRDITKLKRTQQELHSKIQELDRKNQKLKKYVDSNFQLENFAHTVSHDLREPVRTINSFAQLLLQKYQGQIDEDAHTYLDFITASAADMNKLIEDLLEYSRFNNSEHSIEPIPLEELLSAVTTGLSGLINDNNAAIEVLTPLPTVMGNRTKVHQLFQNLISNGIKFRKAGQPPLLQISAQESGANHLIAVKDNGIGIDEEYHEQIFLLFRRLHSKKYYPGSGIGLALCKRIIEQHGGRIWVESEPNKGATFIFTFSRKTNR